ncbi:hypothetical protein [Halopseudomonas sabulinigri]|uniref:Uncharacterized protein n=1 Tax=Halopseudomonas sabulinigri TaxID=472181 RepID=A0ABP9ZSG6_9GAMM
MSNSSDFVSGSIEQILLGLARGLRDAQAVLDDIPPTDAFGRPQSSYHLPYLDFSIKATVQASLPSEQEPAAAVRNLRTSAIKASRIPQLKLQLPDLKRSNEAGSGSTELTSTFSGRLVSVPPSNSLPTLRISARERVPDAASPLHREVLIELSNSAGERIAEAPVELNLDLLASLQLSEAAGANNLTEDQLRTAVQLEQRLVQTDQQGSALVGATLTKALPANTNLVLLINSGATLTQLILTP